ncbi:MAG: 50S ribosomal protein L6 [Patescibacteria group bacterium]
MSRIGKKIMDLPANTEATFSSGLFKVKGPLGELSRQFPETIKVEVKENQVTVALTEENLQTLALWGTAAAHIQNMINGVNKAFEKKLIVEGIGFKSDVKGKELHLALGFSHQIKVEIPDDIKVTADKNIVTVSGLNAEKVGQFAATVRALKKPEPYKGKGIRYEKEVIRRKQGKKSV